jgi:hypothetical protein
MRRFSTPPARPPRGLLLSVARPPPCVGTVLATSPPRPPSGTPPSPRLLRPCITPRARRPGLRRLRACCRPRIDLAAAIRDLCQVPHSSIGDTKPLTPPHRRVHRSRVVPSSGISAAEPNRRHRPTGSPPPRLPSARIDVVARCRTRMPPPCLAPRHTLLTTCAVGRSHM